jgi:perosamine synthetase
MPCIRTLPPAASPSGLTDIFSGCCRLFNAESARTRFHLSLAARFNKKHCFTFSSGKAALVVALKALRTRFPNRSGIVVPAFNCYSVPSAIIHAGCTVIPCETDPDTLDFDEPSLKKILGKNQNILAVFPTHLFGIPVQVDRVRQLIGNSPITIIEDAAQAMGTAYFGNTAFLGGDIVLFSLGRGKAFSAGEGGVLLTSDDNSAAAIRSASSTLPGYRITSLVKLAIQSIAMYALIHPRFFSIPANLPFLKLGETVFDTDFPVWQLSGFQAGSALQWKQRLEAFNSARIRCAQRYVKALSGVRGVHCYMQKETVGPCIRFPVLFENEEIAANVLTHGKRLGLGIAVTYPDAIDGIPEVQNPAFDPCIQARSIARRLLTLPCHQFITRRDSERIVKAVKEAVGYGL